MIASRAGECKQEFPANTLLWASRTQNKFTSAVYKPLGNRARCGIPAAKLTCHR